MKHLKTSSQDLRELFSQHIAVRHIAEPLASFDGDRPAADIQAFMARRDFDTVGVRVDGLVVGYALRADLDAGPLHEFCRAFEPAHSLEDSAPLLDAFRVMQSTPRIFVRTLGQVCGIVTRGDLQKAPVRMWLFGLVSLMEMQFMRIIRAHFPHEGWKSLLSPERLARAEALLRDRRQRNEAIDLTDCLQLGDKRRILLRTERLREGLGFASRSAGDKTLEALEQLRDQLAHAQDIISGNWPGIVGLAMQAEDILIRCERMGTVRGEASAPG